MDKKKLYDLIGIGCGLFLVLVMIVSIVTANAAKKHRRIFSYIPRFSSK